MAKTLSGTGIRPERAYELARLIEQQLVREHQENSYTEAHLYEVAEDVVAANEGEEAVRGLRRCGSSSCRTSCSSAARPAPASRP
jgi:2-phosphoglycerate kinase